MTQIYIYPYLALLALIIVWIIFRHTLVRLYTCCVKRFSSKEGNYNSVEKNSLKVYDLFTQHQLQYLLKVNRTELIKIKN